MTAAVRMRERIIETNRYKLWFLTPKIDLYSERMLYKWKISAMDMVRKAMIMPSLLLTICHAPFSIRSPLK